jgi:hypothetical protein
MPGALSCLPPVATGIVAGHRDNALRTIGFAHNRTLYPGAIMTVFWPGLMTGVLLVALSIIGYRKRKALAKFSEESATWTLGEKNIKKLGGSEAQSEANVMLPIFGAMAMGVAGIIWSLTGVMR